MLYKSLQQTIHEYEKRKKETQSEGERKMFKWKVFTLTFCIIAIVIIGILSQLVKFENDNELDTQNFTFLPSLLEQSNELDQISSIKNFISGLTKSPRITFDKSENLINKNTLNSDELISLINGKRNILYLFSLKEQIDPDTLPKIHRFGMLLKNQFDSEIDPQDSNINVFDNIDDLSSVMFNLNQNYAIRLNLNAGCKIYSFNEITKTIRLIETVEINNEAQNSNKVNFQLLKPQCFGQDQTQAMKQIGKLTGIQLTSSKEVKSLEIQSVQVFYLTLNGENIQ